MRKKTGNRRKTGKEQYYTLPVIADLCTTLVINKVGKDNKFLEPAGGEGSFIEALLKANVSKDKIVSFDIEPKHPMIQKRDFLTVTQLELGHGYITITNPPFGRANSLSKKFFNHCAQFSDYIGFLVPKSWRKWSVHNSLDQHFHLIKDIDLPDVCFYSTAGDEFTNGNLNTIFQIWERRNEVRKKIQIKDYGLIKKTTPEDADVALVVFGWGCGKILREFKRESNTTLMFLKVADKSIIDVLEKLDYSRFYNNVAYTHALSFKEICHLLNSYLNL